MPPSMGVDAAAMLQADRSHLKDTTGGQEWKVKQVIALCKQGQVLLAEHKGETKVIKRVLRNQESASLTAAEVHMGKVLKGCPNTVTVESSWEEGPYTYMLMPWCSGGDLATQLAKGERFPEHKIKAWLHKLLHVLKYIHANKVIHRDIKPQNLFITKDGEIVLGDWDLATQAVLSSDKPYVYDNDLCGTKVYWSPELYALEEELAYFCAQGPSYAEPNDVWQLGYTMYYLVWAKLFEEVMPCVQQTMHEMVANTELKDLALTVPHGYSTELRDVLYQMLTHDGAERPSAAALLDHAYFQDAAAVSAAVSGGDCDITADTHAVYDLSGYSTDALAYSGFDLPSVSASPALHTSSSTSLTGLYAEFDILFDGSYFRDLPPPDIFEPASLAEPMQEAEAPRDVETKAGIDVSAAVEAVGSPVSYGLVEMSCGGSTVSSAASPCAAHVPLPSLGSSNSSISNDMASDAVLPCPAALMQPADAPTPADSQVQPSLPASKPQAKLAANWWSSCVAWWRPISPLSRAAPAPAAAGPSFSEFEKLWDSKWEGA